MGNKSAIGIKQDFLDAREKVTGKSKYIDDFSFSNMLYGKILRSSHPHAIIKNLNISKAEKLTGVKAVITAKDCPQIPFGSLIKDSQIFANEKVRFIGEEIAAVAATSEEIAEEAISLIDVDYEPLEVISSVEEALAPNAILIHNDKKNNIAAEYHVESGDVDKDFDYCDHVFEEIFFINRVQACYMEPCGVIALEEQNGRVSVWTNTQTAFLSRNMLAEALGINPSQISLKVPVIGGGFGGKTDILNFHPISVILAKKTSRPVKIILTRKEEFLTQLPRMGVTIKMKLGMMDDGAIITKQADIFADNGAYSWKSPKALINMCMRTDCLYRFRSSRTHGTLVYTNLSPTGGIRGYGNTHMHFALESMIDICTRKIGLDPIEIRLKNCSRQGETTLRGWKLRSCGLKECIENAYRQISTDRLPKRDQEGRIRRGIGLACVNHVSGNRTGKKFDGSGALIRFHEDGKLMIFSSDSELGQGSSTVFAQIAAEVIGLPIENVIIMPIDTDISPFSLGTFSSRVTTVGGKSVFLACQNVKEQLLSLAGKEIGVPSSQLDIKEGVIFVKTEPEKNITIKDICHLGIRTREAISLSSYISYDPPTEGMDSDYYGDYSSAYSYAAHAVEVEVNVETGKIKVLRVVAAHDSGKIININGALGQITGGVTQGIGWTLHENMIFKEGVPQVTSLKNYLLMTIKDIPKIEPIFVETVDPIGPFGAKGIAEPASIPTGPAIANAIEDAIGVRIKDLPITSEKIFRAMHPEIEVQRK